MPPHSPIDDFLGMRQGAPWRQRLRWMVVAATVAVLVVVVGRFVNGGEVTRYVTTPVKRDDLQVTLSGTGTLQLVGVRPIFAPVSGPVAAILVEPGEHVTAGQVLARLDPAASIAQLDQARNLVATQEASLAKAVANERDLRDRLTRYERVHQASNGLAPSEREMSQARGDLAAASDAVRAAEIEVASGRQALADRLSDVAGAEIHAPADGVVTRRLITLAQRITAHDLPLFEIADPATRLRLEIMVLRTDADALRPGAPATVTVVGLPPAAATVTASRPALSADASRSILALEVVNPNLALRQGMTATAGIALGPKRAALLVPVEALRFARASDAKQGRSQAGQGVYVLGEQGAPRRIPVTVQGGDGRNQAVTSASLQAGMPVILGLR